MKDHLSDLFRYDKWANQRWLDRLREIGDVEDRTQNVYGHLLASKK